jgi:hypothetical protein
MIQKHVYIAHQHQVSVDGELYRHVRKKVIEVSVVLLVYGKDLG